MSKVQKMLVVDDAFINRTLLRRIFEEEYAVDEAEDGIAALNALRTVKYDIVLLDIVMPELDGFGVLAAMRADPALASVPVVVSTGEKGQMEEKALVMGADDFISKPYDPIVVKKRVENIVVKHVLEREKLEYALHETQSELKSLTDSIPGGILVCRISKNWKVLYVNDGFCSLCGYTRREFDRRFAKNLQKLFFPEDLQAVNEAVRAELLSGKRMDITHRILHKSGDLRWLRVSAVRFADEEGEPVFRAVAIDVTDSKENELLVQQRNRELRFLLEHDSLTALHNRSTFYRHTALFLREHTGKRFVLVQLDVERFKVINELYGSETGDKILTSIADAMRQSIGGAGTYGRLEADRFASCLPEDERFLQGFLKHLENAVKGLHLPNTPALYYGIYRVEDASMPVDLMCDRANLALRTVKGNYSRHYAVYDESLHRSVMDEQQIVSEMNTALEEGQFEVYLQPVVSLLSERPVSAEALIRWNHPVKGLISPGTFIPLFEHNGFIVKLDAYVRRKVCQYLSEQQAAGEPCVPVSVNLSRLEFYDPNLCQSILDLVKEFHLDPTMLRLEITESAYTDNPKQLLEIMQELQKHGFLILMDDFGSGYSSLNMLKDVPVDVLKLDMCFLSGEDPANRGSSILAAIIRMAQSLEMVTIAEGIETEEQAEFLKSTGCDLGQGYFYARPIPLPQFKTYLCSFKTSRKY